MNLFKYEKRKFSQNGEDGIISKLIADLNPKVRKSLEFGVQNGTECNTRALNDWETIKLDGGFHNPSIKLYKEFITEHNINELITKYNCTDISLLSIDIDGQDFYVWNSISVASPLIVVIEYNCRIPYNYKYVMKRDPYYSAGPTKDYSCGVGAMYELGKLKNYSLIGSCSNGVNLFFVKNDVCNRLTNDILSQINRPDLVYQKNDFDKKYYITFEEALNIS